MASRSASLRFPGLAFSLAAAFLALGGLPSAAEAKDAPSRNEFAAGPAGDGSAAGGTVDLRDRTRGDVLKLRFSGLEPRELYDIREGATGSVLATVRANRRGRAKARVRAELLTGGATVSLAGLPLELCRSGEEDPVLEGRAPGDAEDGSGEPNWSDCTYRIGEVTSDPEADVQASLVLSSTTVPGEEKSYDSLSLFVSPAWKGEWRDDEWVEEEPVSIPGPVTLWMAGEDGELEKVATLESEPLYFPCPGYDGDDPAGNARGMAKGGVALLAKGEGNDPGRDDGEDGGTGDFHWWYADNYSDGSGLPFGASSVDELVGKAFEVRDAEGAILLEGDVPELETIEFEPWPEPGEWTFEYGSVLSEPGSGAFVSVDLSSTSGPGKEEGEREVYDSISLFVSPEMVWAMDGGMDMMGGDRPGGEFEEIPGPVTFWIADDGGDLVKVATVEASEPWVYGPGDDPMGGGNGMMPGMGKAKHPDRDGDDLPPDPVDYPAVYSWWADNLTGLPLGVESVKDLSGRAFEVRDGEGTVLLSGELPELVEPDYEVVPMDGAANR